MVISTTKDLIKYLKQFPRDTLIFNVYPVKETEHYDKEVSLFEMENFNFEEIISIFNTKSIHKLTYYSGVKNGN